MTDITSFRDVIDLWASKEAMACDLRASEPGLTAGAVSKWWQRDSIPAEWWSSVLGTAIATRNDLNAEKLTMLAARAPAEARP